MRISCIESLLYLATCLGVIESLTFVGCLKINHKLKLIELRRINYGPLSDERCLEQRLPALNAKKENGASEVSSGKYFDAISTPIIAGTVGITAFCFQIFGIFPWHAKLQSGFESVEVNDLI